MSFHLQLWYVGWWFEVKDREKNCKQQQKKKTQKNPKNIWVSETGDWNQDTWIIKRHTASRIRTPDELDCSVFIPIYVQILRAIGHSVTAEREVDWFTSNWYMIVVVVRIFNANGHSRHVEAAEIVMYIYLYSLASSPMHTWCRCLLPSAALSTLYSTQGHAQYELGVLMVWKLSC